MGDNCNEIDYALSFQDAAGCQYIWYGARRSYVSCWAEVVMYRSAIV